MKTPMLEIQHAAEPLVLHGRGAKYVASVGGFMTLRPIDDHDVAVRVPGRATSLRMHAGESLAVTLAAGDIIEIL
ncbi:MAG: hypothetical protein EOQ52_12755 [Mesorhizobium sp.]|uniref:hypothetical protein n=1 Tax=Mesorhizobium sp. TaxID=1871066 RepID=UPI000FE9FD57|nr:hypothetical protein [Mesorhizobium sp.]RWB89239.1 MAG: hypothetical protein EOQ52_12755 [Mesorhizobium sp.]